MPAAWWPSPQTGDVRSVVAVPGGPGGLGWTPDGELLVLDMSARHLLRLEADELTSSPT